MKARTALFRAVNVGGRKVAMADLQGMFETLGLGPARTLQAAGSVVFHADGDEADLETRLEAESLARLGLETSAFVRGPVEWAAALAANPFPDEAKAAPNRLLVTALKREADPDGAAALEAASANGERVAAAGRFAYIFYPSGAGTSKLTPRLIERRLGSPGTARNWNTMLKLMDLMDG